MRLLNAVLALVLGLVLGLALWVAPTASAADPAPSITGIAARSGPLAGGQLVTIRGYHLTGTTSVRFGGVATSTDLQVLSDTHVQVRTPAHAAGGVFVEVVRPDATSPDNAVATYEYLAAPGPLGFGPVHEGVGTANGTLSCASGSFCAVGGMVHQDGTSSYVYGVSVKNGSAWTSAKVFSHSGITGVSCVLTPRKMCMTVGTDGYASRYDGVRWSRTKIAPATTGVGELNDVDCATSSICQAIDGAGNAYRWNGTRWSGPTHLTSARLIAISCPQTTFCYAAADDTTGVRWIGSRWVAAHPIADSGHVHSISCSSSTFCMAGGSFPGNFGAVYLVFTGVAWSPPNQGAAYPVGLNWSPVTCTGPTFCVNANAQDDFSYQYSTYNGSTTDQNPPVGLFPVIDCWAAYQCMSVSGHQWWYDVRG